jgi:hypothetical protein
MTSVRVTKTMLDFWLNALLNINGTGYSPVFKLCFLLLQFLNDKPTPIFNLGHVIMWLLQLARYVSKNDLNTNNHLCIHVDMLT